MILRDHLALDRTVLANERTLLAYIRTALAFLVTGTVALKFFDSSIARAAGGICITAGLMTFVIGFVRYLQVRARCRRAGTAQAKD